MSETLPRAELARPFAIVGAAAGWLAAGVLAEPLIRASIGGNQSVAAISAGVVGATVGALLSRATRSPFFHLRAWHTVALVVSGGVIAGAATQIALGRAMVLEASGAGALAGLAVSPICLAVVAAAYRAERARHGSIVAAADRRAIWRMLVTTLAVTTLFAVPAWAGSRDLASAPPVFALLAAALATLATIFVALKDHGGVRAVARLLGKGDLERLEEGAPRQGTEVPQVDVGLGDDLQARLERGVAYRGSDRVTALVLGDARQALGELCKARRRDLASLAVLSLVLGAHGLAQSRPALDLYRDARCAEGDEVNCHLVDKGAPSLLSEWREVERRCERSKEPGQKADPSACDGVRAIARNGVDSAPRELQGPFERACSKGSGDDCYERALLALISRASGGPDLEGASDWMRRACRLQIERGCADAKLLGSALGQEDFRIADCLLGDPKACHILGDGTRQYALYFGRACDLGDAFSCTTLGDELRASEPSRAKAAYGKACSLGQAYSCCTAAELAARGHTPEARAEATEYFRNAGRMDPKQDFRTVGACSGLRYSNVLDVVGPEG